MSPHSATATLTLSGCKLELVRGDISRQPGFDAVVNAANAELKPGGGVAGAIHRAAGPGLAAECREHAPLEPGQAVLTFAHDLPNRFVIHCLGPVYGVDIPSRALLASCYIGALQIAEKHRLGSIAVPAISTGAFGYPMEDAAEIALRVIVVHFPRLKSVKLVRFVLSTPDALEVHMQVLGGTSDRTRRKLATNCEL